MVSQSVDMPLSEEATKAGTSFVFGYLGGGSLPFEEKYPGVSFVLALQALPLVLVVSALFSLLFYWRILPYNEIVALGMKSIVAGTLATCMTGAIVGIF